MNTRVWGMAESPGQWVFPKVAKNKCGGFHLAKKGLTGGNTRKTILGLEHLVRCTFLPQHDESSWEDEDVRMANALKEVERMVANGGTCCSSSSARFGARGGLV